MYPDQNVICVRLFVSLVVLVYSEAITGIMIILDIFLFPIVRNA